MPRGEKVRSLQEVRIERPELLDQVREVRRSLTGIPDMEVIPFGSSGSGEGEWDAEKVVLTGARLKTASSNAAQGALLARLAIQACRKTGGRINVLELGTAAGISGMYLLAGMGQAGGGRLVTFEGIPELAGLARRHMEGFIGKNGLANVSFEVIVGPFGETLPAYLASAQEPLHLAFIDGHHNEEPTLRYHEAVRKRMHERGIIVHDDIGWSAGMARAWAQIRKAEGPGRTVELCLGNQPSRGILYLDADADGDGERLHLDSVPERVARQVKALVTARG
jgi:predicted O-methyltransferase YrrM